MSISYPITSIFDLTQSNFKNCHLKFNIYIAYNGDKIKHENIDQLTSSVHPPASISVANIKWPLPTTKRNQRPSGILRQTE